MKWRFFYFNFKGVITFLVCSFEKLYCFCIWMAIWGGLVKRDHIPAAIATMINFEEVLFLQSYRDCF